MPGAAFHQTHQSNTLVNNSKMKTAANLPRIYPGKFRSRGLMAGADGILEVTGGAQFAGHQTSMITMGVMIVTIGN
jgi:hypothetical protein